MSSNDLQADPDKLRQWAVAHDRAADACQAARRECDGQLEQVRSWGPLYREARVAAVEAINARAAALQSEGQKHQDMAHQLRVGAQRLEEMQTENRGRLRLNVDQSTET